jgi:hypothetical protein
MFHSMTKISLIKFKNTKNSKNKKIKETKTKTKNIYMGGKI